jgi:hypothetical protein
VPSGDRLFASGLPVMTKATAGVLAASAGFTAVSQVGRIISVIGIVEVRVELTYTGANIVPSGTANITDTSCCVLTTNYRPDEPRNIAFGTSVGTGEVQIGTDGNCVLRSYDATLTSGNVLRFNCTFIKG